MLWIFEVMKHKNSQSWPERRLSHRTYRCYGGRLGQVRAKIEKFIGVVPKENIERERNDMAMPSNPTIPLETSNIGYDMSPLYLMMKN